MAHVLIYIYREDYRSMVVWMHHWTSERFLPQLLSRLTGMFQLPCKHNDSMFQSSRSSLHTPQKMDGKHQSYDKDWCQLLQLAPHEFLGDYWSMDTIHPIAPWTLRELLSSLRGLSNSLLGCSQLGLDQPLRDMFRPATGCGSMPLGSLLFITW